MAPRSGDQPDPVPVLAGFFIVMRREVFAEMGGSAQIEDYNHPSSRSACQMMSLVDYEWPWWPDFEAASPLP